jgi:hypothetical protein
MKAVVARRSAGNLLRFHGAGVAMLSTVLRSVRTIQVNIAIMGAFSATPRTRHGAC